MLLGLVRVLPSKSLSTPLGPLTDVDLLDHDSCAKLLSYDKHQLIEGLVFESIFDQYIAGMQRTSEGVLQPIPVETAVARLPSSGLGTPLYGAFVWAKTKTRGLGRFLISLEKHYRVWLVKWRHEDRTFLATSFSGGHLVGTPEPLERVCAAVSRREPRPALVVREVRDQYRINQSMWGYLSSHYGDRLGPEVVLPRIFFNWGIQPWFRSVWNLDRIFLYDDQLWHMEIKHKYPMDYPGGLCFGINDGELYQISNILNCGLRSLHVVTVKPFWERQSGSMYLLNDIEARSRAAILSMELTPVMVSNAFRAETARSSAHTSFTGRSKVPFRRFEARGFRTVGMLSDSATHIGSVLVSQIRGNDLPPLCTDSEIRTLRISNSPPTPAV